MCNVGTGERFRNWNEESMHFAMGKRTIVIKNHSDQDNPKREKMI